MNYVSKQNIDNIVQGLSNKIVMSVSNGALIGDTTPVGTVISFMGTQAPLFYLICDGSTYNIAEYQELADFIEAQFGAVNYFGGDGVDTFAVPDLQGEFLRGSGTNSHEKQGSGANVGIHQDGSEIPDISNWANTTIGMSVGKAASSSSSWRPGNQDTIYKIDDTQYYHDFTLSTSNSGSYVYTSRPTNTSVLYCIKYTKAVIPSEYEDGTPIGRVIFDSILREGYIKANGAQIEDASISIPRLLSFVQKYSSQLIAPNQATYDANVGLYMYDSNNDILTLPNYIGRFMEGGNNVESIEAGLPNIKGNITAGAFQKSWGSSNGAISYNVWNANTFVKLDPNTASDFGSVVLNANNSNSIYSDTINTVQPSSITLIPQIRY